ncbi:MAG: NAD(P)-binding domain-containing protein, partial [Tabrizicola sp.]|nr:NAD(P)-binding domain-containing protein [Tabrizicola sp.]
MAKANAAMTDAGRRPGFVGTGAIAAAMVEGMGGSALLSPRGADVAADLARRFPDVDVAPSNQALVDACDLVVVSVRPQVAEEVLRSLRFRPGQKLLSLVAATKNETIRSWIGLDLPIIRAIPLPSVAQRRCVTPIFPPDPEVSALFDRMGQTLACTTIEEFDLFAVASALMGSYFGILDQAQHWLVGNGLSEAFAHDYMAGLFAGLGRVAEASPLGFAALRESHSTRGGLNEQAHRIFVEEGGAKALAAALD